MQELVLDGVNYLCLALQEPVLDGVSYLCLALQELVLDGVSYPCLALQEPVLDGVSYLFLMASVTSVLSCMSLCFIDRVNYLGLELQKLVLDSVSAQEWQDVLVAHPARAAVVAQEEHVIHAPPHKVLVRAANCT